MTSLEIAELTGKQHFHVMEAIRKMEPAWVKVCQSKFRLTSRTIENKETGVFDLFSKSSSYPIILGRDRLQI